jgi:hypothetical protein
MDRPLVQVRPAAGHLDIPFVDEPPVADSVPARPRSVLLTTTTLIIYDGWDTLRFVDVAAVVLGPIVAIFASHVFAGVLAKRVQLGRSLTGRERLALLVRESRFLLLALPPLALLSALSAIGLSYTSTIQVIAFVEVAGGIVVDEEGR